MYLTKTNAMKIVNSTLSVLVAASLLLSACGGNDGKEKANDNNQVETGTAPTTADFVLPSPLQISFLFKKAGLKYIPNITNPTGNISKYNTDLSKSLNFGVYSADLSYSVFNAESQQKLDYVKAVKQLSDELGMLQVVDQSLIDSFEKNINNEDSLVSYLAISQEKMDEYLKDNNLEHKEVIFFTGAWIEGMYLGSRDISKADPKMGARLVEQMTIMDNLLIGLNVYPHKDSDIESLIADLTELKSLFKNFEALKLVDDWDDIDFEELKLPKEDLDKLAKAVEKIRTKIING